MERDRLNDIHKTDISLFCRFMWKKSLVFEAASITEAALILFFVMTQFANANNIVIKGLVHQVVHEIKGEENIHTQKLILKKHNNYCREEKNCHEEDKKLENRMSTRRYSK